MTTTLTPIDQAIALKNARRAELTADQERRLQEERANADADAAAFELALDELLSREGVTWLATFRNTEVRRSPAGTHGTVPIFEVRFDVPGHKPIAASFTFYHGAYLPAGASTNGDRRTWWAGKRGQESLADALIAAEEIPF